MRFESQRRAALSDPIAELADATDPFRNVRCEAKGSQVIVYGQGTRLRYAWKNNPIEADCRAKESLLPDNPFEITITN